MRGAAVRVILNTECTFFPLTGVGHYTAELARALARRAATDGDEVEAYPSGALRPVMRFWKTHVARYEARKLRHGALSKLEALARRSYLGVARRVGNLVTDDPFGRAARRGFDLYHEPNFMAQECDLPTVITVHDVSVLRHPEWHTPARVAEYEREFARGLKRACHLVAVSEFTKRETASLLAWPLDRISVAYNGAREHLRPVPVEACKPVLRKYSLAPGYLLHVGSVEPRKNLALLVRAYRALPATVRERHPLVLVGGTGWNSAALEAEIAESGRDWNVRRLGYFPERDMAALYSGARALAFPTLYEGFGMPTVEMLACGGAVLASTAGAVAETVGGAAHLIDPHDEPGWRDALLRVCVDDDWWHALREGAQEAARPFTWDRCAEDTLKAYRAALGQGEVKRAA
jgi:alpha-1,3-rhamnosyl/mannosyltransferase